jgi:nucleotide-binding universal stress UspA family protein
MLQTIISLYFFLMKTIVVPTDFSAPAENAMIYAGQLAKNIGAAVLLLHVYQIPVGMNDMPVLMVPADELKNTAEAGLARTKELLQKNCAGLEVKTESRLGDVVEELRDLCERENPFAIVAGKHGATGIERVLFGSTSLSIIRHTTYPVIVVPNHPPARATKNTAIAIDSSTENFPVQTIRNIASELKTRLHLIHVSHSKMASLDTTKLCAELDAQCQTIYDHEFVRGIENFVQENQIDLLIILPHRHNLIERLFFRTHTEDLLHRISIPIMCVNDNVNRQS